MTDIDKLKALRDRYKLAGKLIEAKAVEQAINVLKGK